MSKLERRNLCKVRFIFSRRGMTACNVLLPTFRNTKEDGVGRRRRNIYLGAELVDDGGRCFGGDRGRPGDQGSLSLLPLLTRVYFLG